MLKDLIEQELLSFCSKERSFATKKFFKTKKGQYSHFDTFIGISIPHIRLVAKRHFKKIDENIIMFFLSSVYHEFRAFAVIVMVLKFENCKKIEDKEKVYRFYVKKSTLQYINNWDLVDLSCYKVIGSFLCSLKAVDDKFLEVFRLLQNFAINENIWIRRISVVSCLTPIKNNFLQEALSIISKTLCDKEDLIQKANGWMLREIGKKDKNLLLAFIEKNLKIIPKTTLRYAKG
jgi:3-methyladenine DNA glycosylase AlkD